ALLARLKKTIETIGRSIPIPFSEITRSSLVSPDKFSDLKMNNPNKIKFNIILSLPITNWLFLFLNDTILTKDNVALNPNSTMYHKFSKNMKPFPEAVVHKGKINGNPPADTRAMNRYMVCILCKIISCLLHKNMFSFLKNTIAQ